MPQTKPITIELQFLSTVFKNVILHFRRRNYPSSPEKKIKCN